MSPDERKIQGPLLNGLRDAVTEAIAARKAAAWPMRRWMRGWRPKPWMSPCRRGPKPQGSVHPISQVLEEITAIFADMGFAVAEGPDVEYRRLQFHQAEHSARPSRRARCRTLSMWRRRRMASSHVLRTHTSPVQVRTMLKQKPPIRIISPGRTYRVDSDATHSPMFHQVEALVVDEGIHLGHLKWTVEEFCKAFFEIDKIELRARPSFFPFHRAVAGMGHALRPFSVPGKITFGHGNDWLELGGCGMVHPQGAGQLRHRSQRGIRASPSASAWTAWRC